MKKIIRNMFRPTLSYWFYLVTITTVFGVLVWWPTDWGGLIIFGSAIFGGFVEGIAISVMDDLWPDH